MSEKEKNSNTDTSKDGFAVPANYFEDAASEIRNKIACSEELQQYAILSKLKKQTGFTVPVDYFRQASDLALYPTLTGAGKKSPFIVPENYFRENADSLVTLLSNDTTASHVLHASNQNPFVVDGDYFARSASAIQERLHVPKTKVIHLHVRRSVLAAAAIFVIVIAVTLYQHYFKRPQVNECVSLACLEQNVLLKTKNLESMENDELYELVDPGELLQQLEKDNTVPVRLNTDSTPLPE